jgi:hypothetical protein
MAVLLSSLAARLALLAHSKKSKQGCTTQNSVAQELKKKSRRI